MSLLLLATKHCTPRVWPELVPHPRSTKNIYDKLNVHTRRQVIVQAKTSGV